MKKHKFDIIVAAVLVLAAVISYIIVGVMNSDKAGKVEVVIDGRIEYTYPLDKDGEYVVENDEFINVIVVKDTQVSMKEADCPDKLCIKQGTISKNGQSIICLPHKLVVKITSNKEDTVDAYAK